MSDIGFLKMNKGIALGYYLFRMFFVMYLTFLEKLFFLSAQFVLSDNGHVQ